MEELLKKDTGRYAQFIQLLRKVDRLQTHSKQEEQPGTLCPLHRESQWEPRGRKISVHQPLRRDPRVQRRVISFGRCQMEPPRGGRVSGTPGEGGESAAEGCRHVSQSSRRRRFPFSRHQHFQRLLLLP